MNKGSLLSSFLIGVLLGLALYTLKHRNEQEPINMDSALDETVSDANERAIAKMILSDEEGVEAVEQLIASLQKAA